MVMPPRQYDASRQAFLNLDVTNSIDILISSEFEGGLLYSAAVDIWAY